MISRYAEYHWLVIWLQGGVCFLLWLAYGVIQTRRSNKVRSWSKSIPRTWRGLVAAGLMVGSITPVFLALTFALSYHGFSENGMAPFVWVEVALLGLLFVHGQTLATALLVTSAHEAVTATRSQTSTNTNIPSHEDHEASPS